MGKVEAVRGLLELAREMGYEIREEWLAGTGCSVCELRGKPVLFVDAACSAQELYEQLHQILCHPEGIANSK